MAALGLLREPAPAGVNQVAQLVFIVQSGRIVVDLLSHSCRLP